MRQASESNRPLLLVVWLFLAFGTVQATVWGQDEPQPPVELNQPTDLDQPADEAATPAVEQPQDEQVADAPEAAVEVEAVFDVQAAEDVEIRFDQLGLEAQNPQFWLLRNHVRVNSALARRVSKLSEVEEQKLEKLNDVWIRDRMQKAVNSPAKAVAAGIARFLGGRAAPVRNVGGDDPVAVLTRVRAEIDQEIAQALEADHREAFLREQESRDSFRKQAMAAVLVSSLDERLYLTQEQRDALNPLVTKWLSKELYWQFYFQNAGYVPSIPQNLLSKVLTADQLSALQGAQAWNSELSQIELQIIGEEPAMIAR